MPEKAIGFQMIYIGSEKFMVGDHVANAIRDQADQWNYKWQEEHTLRIQLEERLKIAEVTITDLRGELTNLRDQIPFDEMARVTMLEDKVKNLTDTLRSLANKSNWETETLYGPYGSYYKTIWIGSQSDIDYAQEILTNAEEE